MWKPLKLATQDEATTRWLVKYEFGSTDYAIYLTDLTYLWTESLDRKQIIRRALELNTSIDPSEDASQMQLLLNHVKEALEGVTSTSVRLTGNDDSNNIQLNISVILPSPLPLLEWPVNMARLSQDSFTCHFLLPSLSQTWSLRAQVKSLLDNLREKDNVIRKLTDRMQSDGTDFSKIFPGTALTKSRSRVGAKEAAAKVVKGLAEFNEYEWRTLLSEKSRAPSSIDDLVTAVFPTVDDGAQETIPYAESQIRWSQQLQPDRPRISNNREVTFPHIKPEQTTPSHQADSSIEDDFQSQQFPPHVNPNEAVPRGPKQLPQRTMTGQEPSDGGDSTTDDSEEENVVQANPQPSKAEPPPPLLASQNTDSNFQEDKPVLPNNSSKTFSARASEKHEPRSPTQSASEPETEDGQGPSYPTTHQSTDSKLNVDPAKPKNKLGTIGSRNKKFVRSSDDKSSSDKDHPKIDTAADGVNHTGTAATRKPKHKLGKIGSKAKAGTSIDKESLNKKAHSPDLQKGFDLPSEDEGSSVQVSSPLRPGAPADDLPYQVKQQSLGTISEIQANENRERLKRELEVKSKAANKKRRKF